VPAGLRGATRRALRLTAFGGAAPAVAGALVTALVVMDRPAGSGPASWTVLALCAVPSALVHWRGRKIANQLTWPETVLAATVAGAAAYAVCVVGLAVGATIALAFVVAAQTGVLQGAAQLAGIVSAARTLTARRRRPA
jgi:hypothetical protein